MENCHFENPKNSVKELNISLTDIFAAIISNLLLATTQALS